MEEAAATLTNSLVEWRPEAESSITSVKLELSKLNKFFDRDTKPTLSTQSDVLPLELAAATTPPSGQADGPNGHRVPHNHRECGFERVYTQVHDPVTGTISSPLPQPQSPVHSHSMFGFDPLNLHPIPNPSIKLPLGMLPKFDGENPKLWQSRYEIYSEMYMVEPQIWVRVATMHFEGVAARWLQSLIVALGLLHGLRSVVGSMIILVGINTNL